MSMNLVEQVARLIDCEGAYDPIGTTTEYHGDVNVIERIQIRREYFRAQYELRARDILKLLLKCTNHRGEIVQALRDHDLRVMDKLKVPEELKIQWIQSMHPVPSVFEQFHEEAKANDRA